MKSFNVIIKNFGFSTIILAFLISVHLLMTISSENNIINIKDNNNNNNNNNNKDFFRFKKFNFKNEKTVKISEGDFENFTNFNYFIDILIKCGFAFLLGALISERKFINLGKI